MTRTLIVTVPHLNRAHKAAIYAVADKNGFDTQFEENAATAFPNIHHAEIIFGSSPDLAKHAPHLRWLCTPSAGVNQFLKPDTFVSPDPILTNSSGAYGVTIAEHIVMVTLEMMRRQLEYTQIVNRREWIRSLSVRSIRDSRITMLGTGDIGQETAKRLRAFMPQWLVGVNRSGKNPENFFEHVLTQNQLNTILPETDLLIMSLPGTIETNRLMDAKRLALLAKGSLIVNVGRGSTIDQRALFDHLNEGRLYAALDVFEQEPLPQDDAMWCCPNLLITPHVAGNLTLPYTVNRIVELFIEDFENYCTGRPLKRQVDIKLGY